MITSCPALFLSAPASGQGKTTVTAILARWLTNQGKKVRIFKTGPDYLDPQILQQACGYPVEQLDLWMCGEQYCRQRIQRAAQDADLILIEGAMGMFDGDPSSADLAALFGIPVALIMNVSAMAQTAAAIATGLANFRTDIQVVGLIANYCASQRHRELIEQALPDTLPLLLTLPRNEEITFPERHLGLVQASEIKTELETKLEQGAKIFDGLSASDFLDSLPDVHFSSEPDEQPPQSLNGVTIAIARDEAFSFIYQANTELLQSMGADIRYFSPIHDHDLPAADALWLPGGYPELHAEQLSQNTAMREAINHFKASQKPILAECGGFLYCLEQLTLLDGQTFLMSGLLAGNGYMKPRGGCQGMQSAPLTEGEIRGHSHHRSAAENTPDPIAFGKRAKHPAPGEAIFRDGKLTASYLHLFFPSNPQAIACLFRP